MTSREAIRIFRESYPTSLGEDVLAFWLSELEGKIKTELADTHEWGAECAEVTLANCDDELAAPHPYDGVYVAYLRMKCDLEYNDGARYGTSSSVFGAAWSELANFINRTYPPKQKSGELKTR